VTANERRLAILESLCNSRQDTIDNLAFAFKVSRRTIRYDIETLSLDYPISTVQGNGGGVYVSDGFYIGRKYLKPSQKDLLERLSKTIKGKDLELMQDILKSFSNPKNKIGGQ